MLNIGIIYRAIVSSGIIFLISCTQFSPSPVSVTQLPTNILGGSGIVNRVLDGDSVLIDFDSKTYNTRLACVDAMESDAPLGSESTEYLKATLPKNTPVDINVVDIDKYGRLIVLAWKNSELINSKVVRAGSALIYRKFLKNCDGHQQSLIDSEKEAKLEKVGYWGLPEPQQIEPWVWRKNRK